MCSRRRASRSLGPKGERYQRAQQRPSVAHRLGAGAGDGPHGGRPRIGDLEPRSRLAGQPQLERGRHVVSSGSVLSALGDAHLSGRIHLPCGRVHRSHGPAPNEEGDGSSRHRWVSRVARRRHRGDRFPVAERHRGLPRVSPRCSDGDRLRIHGRGVCPPTAARRDGAPGRVSLPHPRARRSAGFAEGSRQRGLRWRPEGRQVGDSGTP